MNWYISYQFISVQIRIFFLVRSNKEFNRYNTRIRKDFIEIKIQCCVSNKSIFNKISQIYCVCVCVCSTYRNSERARLAVLNKIQKQEYEVNTVSSL